MGARRHEYFRVGARVARGTQAALAFAAFAWAQVAHWIAMSTDISAALLVNFAEKYWRLPKPEVLISVLDDARAPEPHPLSAQLKHLFEIGLVKAVSASKA